jgi:subtilase family protein
MQVGMIPARISIYPLLLLAVACGGGESTPPPNPAATLALIVQPPSQAESGVTLTSQPVVQLQDDQGASVAQAGVPVTVSIGGGGGSLVGVTTISTVAGGRAAFTGLALRGPIGPHALTFASAGLTAVTSETIDLAAGAAAAIVAVDGDQQTAAIGATLATRPSVAVSDADNNRVSGVPVTFEVASGGGTVDPTAPVNTDANGMAAVVSWTLGTAPGTNTLRASAPLTGPPVVFTATGLFAATIRGTITLSNDLAGAGSDLRSRSNRTPASRHVSPPLEYSRDELLVTFRPQTIGAPPLGSAALALRSTATAVAGQMRSHLAPHLRVHDATITGVSPVIRAMRLRVHRPVELAEVAAALRKDPTVATVERSGLLRPASLDRVPSNDPLYAYQAWHYGMIDLPEAWGITTGSAGVLVAVVDDGIRFDHPGIAANLTSDGYDFVTDASIALCSGGTVSQSGDGDDYDPDPTNPAGYDYDPSISCLGDLQSFGGHGLHMAGTIGAVGNDGIGVSGVNWSVRIRPVRALGAGGGQPFDVAQGILYAAGLPVDDGKGGIIQAAVGARVINLSLGGGDYTVVRDAVTAASNAGALIVAAVGNEFGSAPQYPAAYPEALSVSAVGPDRQLTSYSNLGSTAGIAAPGGDIPDDDLTFGVRSTMWNFVTSTPTYGTGAGTSISTSHVSGVAALVLAQNPGLSRSQLRARLTSYAVDAGAPGPDEQYGAGIINARNSLAQNFGPPRQLRARLYDAITGAALNTVAVSSDGSYSFTVVDGEYRIFAGQDENSDQRIGVAGRRWGALGGAASPSVITVAGPGTHHASFSIGFPAEVEPNGTFGSAHVLPVGGYLLGRLTSTDADIYRVLIDHSGDYTFETVPVDGACGFALEGDTELRLYDADGGLLTSNDNIDTAGLNFCSRISRSLIPGVYRLRVQGQREGVYQVQVRSGP